METEDATGDYEDKLGYNFNVRSKEGERILELCLPLKMIVVTTIR